MVFKITLLLKDMFTNDGGVYFFKFHDDVGIDEVANNGPWMLLNVPMIAWSLKRSSALASSLGKPIIMDDMTSKMCLKREGRIGFARVLVELDARKMIKDKINVMNIELEKNNNGKVILENKTLGQTEKGDSTITMTKNEIRLRLYIRFTLLESLVNNEDSIPSNEMIELQECIADIEVGDILNTRFHFIWTKSLRNPNCRNLKKLDIIINEDFMDKFSYAHGLFLPYVISDHSLDVLHFPNVMPKCRKAFRFSNFITEKKEFCLLLENGNVFEMVINLRNNLKDVQAEVDSNPHCIEIKEKSCKVLNEYIEEVKDKNNLRNRSRFGINKWYQSFAWRNFDLEDMELESTNSGPAAKLPILKLGEYEMCVIRIKQYFQIQDYALWEVIENGDSWVLVPHTS
ncbi:hypothetical protein Tco_1345159 [Tanacetum coccineum]